MDKFLNKSCLVVTQDGRVITGTLKGVDQTCNLILSNSMERVFSSQAGVETLPLGLYIIRGDNVAVVGQVDEEVDQGIDVSELRAAPLNPVVY
eukprot:m.63512 g.63512  ORF g.63512 m.63512 type:complete len:93 (-) comp13469_c0_seq5:77-355(-)